MKLQLRLMALTVALFSFVNAAHDDVTDDVDALLGAAAPKNEMAAVKGVVVGDESASAGEKVLHLKESVASLEKREDTSAHAQRKKVLKEAFVGMGSACKNVSGAVWDYTTSGALGSDLKDVHDWVLSEENVKKANHYKDRAYDLCHTVGVTVPKYASAAALGFLLDSVTFELIFESTPWAMLAGGTLCYVASRFNPLSSRKPACNPRAEHCKEELMRLLALKAMLENQQKVGDSLVEEEASSSDDEEDTVKKAGDKYEQHAESIAAKLKESDAKPVVDDLLKEKEDVKPIIAPDASVAKKHEAAQDTKDDTHASHHSDDEDGLQDDLSLAPRQIANISK